MVRLMRWMLVLAVMLVVAAPAYAQDVVQLWKCEMVEDVGEEELASMMQLWLEGARQMDGGSEFELALFFPVVVGNTGQMDFQIVLTSPSFTAWGKFWDAYDDDSPTAKLDDMNQGRVVCPDSVLWEKHKIEPQ